MKQIILIFILLIFGTLTFAEEDRGYEQIYRNLEPADFSYVHNIDPGETYDVQNTSWSPYPLFRLTSPLIFKNIRMMIFLWIIVFIKIR